MKKDQTQIQITIDNSQFEGYTHPQIIEYFRSNVAPALVDYVSGTVRCTDDDKGDKDNGSSIKWDFSLDGSVDSNGKGSIGGKFTIGGTF